MRRRPRLVDRPIVDLATHEPHEVTLKVLATYAEVDRRTIVRMIRAGTLKAHQVGREWRITTEDARRAFHVEQPLETTTDHATETEAR